ncbi:MAG: DUF397 domain-containing protein [Hamadaea sp.]|nr:DUF397 domain-containing protein [Hamadaea sp.]
MRREGIKFVTDFSRGGAPYLELAATPGFALAWRKSRRSNASGNCVEVARLPHGDGIAIRNSRSPEGPALVFTPDEIAAFVAGVRDGDFDDLVSDRPGERPDRRA